MRFDRQFLKSVAVIGLPIAFQNLLGTTASMVDTIMIGTRGELAVASVGVCSQIGSLLFSAYFGFASGGMLFFSQFWGAKNETGIRKTYGLTLLCMLAVGLAFGALSVLRPEVMLGIYTDKEDLIRIGSDYLRIVGLSYPVTVLSMAASCLLRSTERVKIPLYASLASLLTNVTFNWLLIFGKLGFPELGVRGAAIATVLASLVYLVLLVAMAARARDSILFAVREFFHFDKKLTGQYFVKSFPMIANEMLYGVGQAAINIIMGRQAQSAIAAMAVFRVVEGIIFAFFGGMASADSVIVGKQIGAGAHREGLRDAKRFALLCPAVTLLICLLLLPVRRPLLAAFGLGDEAMRYGMWMLLVYTGVGTVRTCNYLLNCTFRAGGEPVFGTLFEIGCLFFITVPAVYLTGIVWRLPFLAVFAVMFIDEFVRLAIGLWYLFSARWIRPVTAEGREALPAFHVWLRGRKERTAEE